MAGTGTGPGKGRYTTYVPPKSTRRSFFEKLFKGDNQSWNPTIGSTEHAPPFFGMDQAEAIEAAAALGNNVLRGQATDGIIAGDPNMFPNGVDLKYTGVTSEIQAPNTLAGKDNAWEKAGDPANSYVPDLTSPGPGRTAGLDKDVNPEIKSSDLKPNYVAGAPDTGTKSPAVTSGKLYDQQSFGTSLDKGKSGGDV